ncbi:MAG: DASS family sodium-coupled anion symporter [Bdellovibrionales bacterium]|nr:DASS family sodium-coupled anion symporter [Bdellovibrionales bacterium]
MATSRIIGLVFGPSLFLLLLRIPHPEPLNIAAWSVIGVMALMIVWWVTEAVPLAVTALLPLVLLPLLGISPMKEAAAPYSDPIVWLFFGGFMIARALEKWGLHQRIALRIILITGTNANGILLGFMCATAFLSMWISNTATAALMLPIAASVITMLNSTEARHNKIGMRNFALSLMLLIAYGANIGGTATLVGTPPNLVLAGIMRSNHQLEIEFAQWSLMAIPFALVLLGTTYVAVVLWLYPNSLGALEGGRSQIKAQYQSLGARSKEETRTLCIFVLTALCWTFREQINELLLHPSVLTDPEIAVWAAILLFVVPRSSLNSKRLLEWEDTQKLPWGILLLFGGGLSLAGAMERTGIVAAVAAQFAALGRFEFWLLVAVTAGALLMTEIMSNLALVTVLVPVVGGMANGLGVNPLLACIPVTLAASCAFMLPMSTPPNAIVFASGHVTIRQMVRAGLVLNVAALALIALLSATLLPWIFD